LLAQEQVICCPRIGQAAGGFGKIYFTICFYRLAWFGSAIWLKACTLRHNGADAVRNLSLGEWLAYLLQLRAGFSDSESPASYMSHVAATHETSLLLTLEEISQLVSHSHHPGETLANIVRLIQGRFHTDVCSVYLLEPAQGELVLGATVGLKPESV